MTEKLNVGYPITLTQTTSYALPAVKVTAFSTTTTGFQMAGDVAFGTPMTVVPDANGQFTAVGGFIRNTGAAVVITLKRD